MPPGLLRRLRGLDPRLAVPAAAGCCLLAVLLADGCGGAGNAGKASTDPVVRRATVAVAHSPSLVDYRGPLTGPPAQPAARVVLVAADLTNGAIAAIARGAEEAVGEIGWSLKVIDGGGTAEGEGVALREAIRSRPGGIIIAGVNAAEQRGPLSEARAHGIPVVGWQASATPGAQPKLDLFTNVTADPGVVGRLSADWVIAASGGTAGVVIYTDPDYPVDASQSKASLQEFSHCTGCSVLAVADEPVETASTSSASTMTAFLERYGRRMNYVLAVNNAYIEGVKDALVGAGRSGDQPPFSIVAGEGIEAEFARIRSDQYQRATVAEPLNMAGWQLIDEINRARAGGAPSAYLAPPRLITQSNVPSGPVFDPPSGYRKNYERIWHR